MEPNYTGQDARQKGPQNWQDQTRAIDARIRLIVPEILKGQAYGERKVTDTPTDALMVVNRRFVTLNGTTAQRPTGSITGQMYFDTDDGAPRWWDGTTWVDSTGTPA